MTDNKVSAISRRLRAWQLFSQLASSGGRVGPLLFALAFGWAHEACGHPEWVFTFGVRSLLQNWAATLRRALTQGFRPARAPAAASPAGFDVLIVPQFASSYYLAPCLALAKALLENQPPIRVAVLRPRDISEGRLLEEAAKFGCAPELLDLDLPVPLLPISAVVDTLRSLLKLFALRKHQEIAEFFRARPIWSRFVQVLSNRLILGHAERELRRCRVRKIVTMNEQWFPGNLLVVAANQLGIETHQVLHGGIATAFCIPFQSRYLWPEYKPAFEQLLDYGIDSSRLKLVPGLQIASQLAGYRPVPAKPNAGGRRFSLLFLAQYHGYSKFNQPCYREALLALCEALAPRRTEWELVIRPHPADDPDDLAAMEHIIAKAGLSGQFVDPKGDLAEQAARSALVVSATSSAIFLSIAVGTPACLIWGAEQQEGYGRPYLPPEWVAHRPADLVRILDRVASADPAAAESFAAQQAEALGLADWQHSPQRACRELVRDLETSG